MELLEQLEDIDLACKLINDSLNYEYRICSVELEDRQRLGLRGSDAIKHFNEWMLKYNLSNLVVNE